MKKLVIASVIAVFGGLVLAPQTARAGNDKVWAALGGFVGGVIVGSALDSDHVDATVVVETGNRHHYRHHDRHGHWKVVSVRTWVPGRWVIGFDDCGRKYRHFQPGHYTWTKKRVRVDGHRDHHYGFRDRRGYGPRG